MNASPILSSSPAYPRPWSVWADDECLARFANEPSEERLQALGEQANARGWNGTLLEVHKHGSWRFDFPIQVED